MDNSLVWDPSHLITEVSSRRYVLTLAESESDFIVICLVSVFTYYPCSIPVMVIHEQNGLSLVLKKHHLILEAVCFPL